MGPADQIVVVSLIAAQLVRHRKLERDRLGLQVATHLVRRSLQDAFAAGAIVAFDADNQRVVELGRLFQAVENAADFMIALRYSCGIHLHHPGVDLLSSALSVSMPEYPWAAVSTRYRPELLRASSGSGV